MQTFSVEGLVGGTFGSFRLTRLLGHGSLSAVYEAFQVSQNRSVMLTMFIVPETLSSNARERFRTRFLQEGMALSRLNHPALLPILECGELAGSPYLVTPFANKVPLAILLKQRGRFTSEETLFILKQVAASLDYAHGQRVIHGTLSPTNILVDQDLSVMVAGFGLTRLLEQRGIVPLTQAYAHLLSIGGTFLGAPEYLAPEVVQDQTFDGRADIYALGVVLYQLLSGSCPFGGANPYEVALQHGRQHVPPLHEVDSSVPAALDVVVGQAMELDPARRYPNATALAGAFERVLNILQAGKSVPRAQRQEAVRDPLLTLPPTVDWFSLEGSSMPGSSTANTGFYGGATQQMQVEESAQLPPTDPFSWWSSSQAQASAGQMPSTGTPTVARLAAQQARKRTGRRRTLTMLAAGGVVTVGLVGFGGVSLAQFLQKKPNQGQAGPGPQANVQPTATGAQKAAPSSAPTRSTTKNTLKKPAPAPTKGAQPTPAPTQPSTKNQPPAAPTQAPAPTQPPAAPTPTTPPAPTPTPKPPTHTGTVIGMTDQATNSSAKFTNPADGTSSLLIHLPDGSFVAFESVCTHEGASCSYDGNTIVCSRHNAMFDPKQGAKVVMGPATVPLKSVPIRINADGTITTG